MTQSKRFVYGKRPAGLIGGKRCIVFACLNKVGFVGYCYNGVVLNFERSGMIRLQITDIGNVAAFERNLSCSALRAASANANVQSGNVGFAAAEFHERTGAYEV